MRRCSSTYQIPCANWVSLWWDFLCSCELDGTWVGEQSFGEESGRSKLSRKGCEDLFPVLYILIPNTKYAKCSYGWIRSTCLPQYILAPRPNGIAISKTQKDSCLEFAHESPWRPLSTRRCHCRLKSRLENRQRSDSSYGHKEKLKQQSLRKQESRTIPPSTKQNWSHRIPQPQRDKQEDIMWQREATHSFSFTVSFALDPWQLGNKSKAFGSSACLVWTGGAARAKLKKPEAILKS